jgi:hypothetical protein
VTASAKLKVLHVLLEKAKAEALDSALIGP